MDSERAEVHERVRAEASRDQRQACGSPRQQGFQVIRVLKGLCREGFIFLPCNN